MRKITVFIEGTSQTIELQESILTTTCRYDYMQVKKATIFWEYKNISQSFTAMTNNGNVINIHEGYYTFDPIKKLFKNSRLEATKHNGKCSIETDPGTTIEITNNLANILGFKSINRTFYPNSKTNSDYKVNINLGLEYIKVHCNIIDKSKNIDETGKKDDTIVSLPITTTQTLYGSVQSLYDIESKVPVNKGVINQLRFNVTDQDCNPINAGKILLECYLM